MKQKEMKLVGEKDIFFGYFKKKIISCLSDLENGRRIQKAHGYAVGTVRTWKGKEYIKTAPGKWRRKHSGETRGAKLSVAALKRKADKCTSSQELLQLVLENKSRFTDGNGHPLPFVKELSDYVLRLNDVLEASGENGRSDPKKELTLSDSQIKYLLQKSKEKMNDKIPSKERYLELFSNGVDTPIGKVKMGENQYEKFVEKGREYLIESAYRTLKAPAFIFNENDTQIFVKSFEVLGGKDKNVISVIITRDGNKISISTHERKLKEIINKAKKSRDVVFTTDTGNAGIQQVQNEQDANPPDKSGNNEAFDKPKASGKQLPKGTSQPDNSIILQGDKKSRENEKKQELYSTDIGSKVPIAKVDVNSDGTFSINADSKTAKVLDAMMKARRKDGNGPSAFYFVNVDKKNNTLITSDGRQLMAVKVNGLDKLDSHTDYLYNVEKKGKSYVFVATKETGIMPYQKVTPDAKPENNIEMNSGDFYSALAVCEQMSKEAKKNGRSEEACLISVMDGNAYVSHYDPESEQYNFMKVGTSKLPDCHRRFSIRYLLNSKSIINGDNFNFNMPMPISEEGSGRELAASISTENLNFIVMPKIVEGEKVAFPAKSLILDNVKNPAELLAEMKAKKSSSKPIKKSFSGRVEDFNTRFLNGYVSWRQWNHMKNDLLKSRSHKYVKRVPKTSGKGYRYFYAKDFKTPFRSLLNFFGIGKARIEKDYEGHHIEKDFGVSKSVFAQHVLHYFLNKAKWDKVFSGTKQKEQKKNSEGASSSGTEKKNPTEQKQKQKTDQPVYSKALMRRIYSIYNGSGQKDSDANEHDNRSRAMLGNENAKKEFSSLSEGEKIEKGKAIKENIVCKIEKDSGPYNGDGMYDRAAAEWVKNNHQTDAKTIIGNVIINKKSVVRDMHHGEPSDKYIKLQTLPAIKSVLEKGVYIGYEKDFNGENIDNHYFAGKVQYGDEDKIIFCRVRETAGDTNRFYVHEVFTDEEIKKEADNAVTDGSLPLLIGKPLYKFILQDVLNVKDKTENISNVTDKEREAAGYPKRELFERYSAVDDATWDPKSKEYRYRDTGYIAGARKELAAGYLISAGKNRARVKDFQIDWEGLEENPRMAEKLIVKSNIFGEVDWDNLKDNGMSGSAAFLVDRIFASAGAKPEQTNPEARRNYVIAVNGMRDRLESCKTVEDVLNVLREIRDERNGIFLSVRNTPEYMKLYDEYWKVLKEIDNVYLKSKSLERATIHAFFVAREKAMKLVVAEAKKNGHLKPNQKKLSYIQDDNLFSKYTNEASEIAKKDEDYIKAAAAESDFKKQSGLVKLADKRDSLQTELKELEHQHALKALKANPLHQAWIQLGKKFNNILRSPSFLSHVANARRGKYDDWQWSQKSEFKEKQTGAKRKAVFELEVASVLTRKGGRNVKAESTQELKDAFRLRDVQSGNWVLNDPESAKFHVDNLASGFADLADMTGIADSQISLNGRLAMAIGARGAGGNAKAHYEPVERVINITKMKGGGSLAHEWFHAFDNLLTESMTGGHIGDFLTNPTRSMPKKKADIFNEIKSLLGKDDTYSQYRLDRKIREAKNEGMDIQALLDQDSDYAKVRGAFDNLTKAMLEGNIPIKIKQNYTERDYRIAKVHFDERTVASSTFKQKIVNAGSLDKAVEVLSQYSNGKSWIPIVCAYYDKNPQGGTVEIPSGKSASSYYIAAQQLESGSKPYWSTPHEMAARAFSAYVDDKLREKDRHNDYLAYKTSNRYYRGGEPYPSGDERKKINGAFDNLFRVVKETNAIRKALSGWLP